MKKRPERRKNTARALAVVRFRHRPPACYKDTHKQTDRTDYNTLRHWLARSVTSAHLVMTSVKRMDKVRNSTVLASVSRHDLIYTLRSRQLRFLVHLLRSDRSLYTLYEPYARQTRRRRPRTNYINCIPGTYRK